LTHPFVRRGLGFVVSVLVDPKRDIGFIAGLNPRLRLLIGYCFKRRDFPWAAVWEENCAISAPPWNRRTQARGLEFSTSPIPVPRREAFAMGTLFGTSTFSVVPARGRKTVNYTAFLASMPVGFNRVDDIQVVRNEIRILGPGQRTLVLSAGGLGESGGVNW
jgi:hypothetical protein